MFNKVTMLFSVLFYKGELAIAICISLKLVPSLSFYNIFSAAFIEDSNCFCRVLKLTN